MKKEFNLRSLAKALAHDISPARIHKSFKKMNDAYFELNPEIRLASSFSHAAAAAQQVWGASLSMASGVLGTTVGSMLISGGSSSFETAVIAGLLGAGGGLTLLNPVCSKLIMKYHEASARRWGRITGKEENEFPQFEAFPEFRKAWAGNELKPQ